MTNEEKAREIALWLYGPDEGMSEGLVRTLIDKITEALAAAEKKGREERYILKAEIDQAWNEAIEAASNVLPSLDECQMWFQYLEIPRKATESSRHYFKKIITESINKLKRGYGYGGSSSTK